MSTFSGLKKVNYFDDEYQYDCICKIPTYNLITNSTFTTNVNSYINNASYLMFENKHDNDIYVGFIINTANISAIEIKAPDKLKFAKEIMPNYWKLIFIK